MPPVPFVNADFSLTDHHGRHVSIAAFAGKYILVFFGFTHCRVVCPRALSRIDLALAMKPHLIERVQPVYITVDPERDTPDVMKRFLEADHPLFVGLTGPSDEIERTKSTFRVFASRKRDDEDPDGYAVPHTAITYLLGGNGQYLAHFPDTIDAAELASSLERIITGEG
jgi:protein SCO1/2